MEKFFVWLRWFLVGPVALVGLLLGFIIGIFVNLQIGGETAEKYSGIFLVGDMLGGMLAAFLAVSMATLVAPSHRKQVGWTLSLLCLVTSAFPFLASNSWDFSKDALIEWAVVVIGMSFGITVVAFCFHRKIEG